MSAEAGPTITGPTAEQAYARVLRRGGRLGVVAMAVTFALYVSGIVPPLVPIDQLPRYWGLSAADYVRAAKLPQGWGWMPLVGRGDVLNFIGVVLLAALTIVAYVRIVPILFRRRDLPYLFIVVAEIAVLALAASGILTGAR